MSIGSRSQVQSPEVFKRRLAQSTGAEVVGYQGRTVAQKLDDIVNVKDYGADGVRTTDQTTAMESADATGKKVYYPNGVYLYTGNNLTFAGGIERESVSGVVFTNGRYDGNIAFDRSGALIGLHHNHLEEKATLSGITPAITTGNILPAPALKNRPKTSVDILAFWYQDFGLDSIRDSAVGSNKWYSWEWAHTDSAVSGAPIIERGYQDKRHPMLGWYRGDDKNVLDWQCYWLAEAGVTAPILQPRGVNVKVDTATWTTESDINNWIYKLLNTVPNAENLAFIPWCDHGDFSANYGNAPALAAIEAAWDNNIQVFHDSGKAYTVSHDSKKYICVYVFDSNSLRGDFDNYSGSTNLRIMLEARATFCQTLGYDGICIINRNPISHGTLNRGDLMKGDVLYIGAHYTSTLTNAVDSVTYPNYSDSVDAWSHDLVPATSIAGVHTDAESSGHPSDWEQINSSPLLFKKMLKKAVDYAVGNPAQPNIVTIYNVSEWAESGASLQPTIGHGWGYLDAVREVITSAGSEMPMIHYERHYQPSSYIYFKSKLIGLGTSYAVTWSFTPLLRNGDFDGQEVTLINYGAVSTHPITLQDDSVLAGSKVFFRGGTNKILQVWESVRLVWFGEKGWVEI